MELSKQMMDGEKWNTFVLQLSFIGWYLLCSITFGIGSSSWSLMYRPLSQSFTLRCAPRRLPTDTPMSMNWAASCATDYKQ